MSLRGVMQTGTKIPTRSRVWKTLLLLAALGVFYYISVWCLALVAQAFRYSVPILPILVGAAASTTILHFIISGVMRKSGRNVLIPSIQVFLFFSALPYILLLAFPLTWESYPGIFGMVVFHLPAVLPELLCFTGLIWLKRNAKWPSAFFIAASALAAFEILPLRISFMFPDDTKRMHRFYHPEAAKPFGKTDRESEFKRSLDTINSLIISSRAAPSESLTQVIIGVPDLQKYPDILKLNTGEPLTWKDFVARFEVNEFALNAALDTDGDGLSDFEKAEMLSDAYKRDTDDDGIDDKEDSDPLNPFVASRYAEVNAAVLESFAAHLRYQFLIVDNQFYRGRGEIANFSKHVILLEDDQVQTWDMVFGRQYSRRYGPDDYGLYMHLGRSLFDLSGRIALVYVVQYHGIGQDSNGIILALARFRNGWRVIAINSIWI